MVIAPVSPSLNTRKWLPDTRFRSVCKASRPTLWSGCDSAREVCSSSLSSARIISRAPQMLPSEAITHFPAALFGAEGGWSAHLLANGTSLDAKLVQVCSGTPALLFRVPRLPLALPPRRAVSYLPYLLCPSFAFLGSEATAVGSSEAFQLSGERPGTPATYSEGCRASRAGR